ALRGRCCRRLGGPGRDFVEGNPRRPSGGCASWRRSPAGAAAMRARPAVREPLVSELESARRFLWRAMQSIPEELWTRQPSPAYSPIGWHLGHVAAVETRWLLPGEPARYGTLFEPTATVKSARGKLPKPAELRVWLAEVRSRVIEGL